MSRKGNLHTLLIQLPEEVHQRGKAIAEAVRPPTSFKAWCEWKLEEIIKGEDAKTE